MIDPTRRQFLRASFARLGVVLVGPTLFQCGGSQAPSASPRVSHFPAYDPPPISPPKTSNIKNIGPLGAANDVGLRLPDGFTGRVVARSQEKVAGTDHTWHSAPDGGACFLANDGSYVYVSNSEVIFDGGVSALHFDKEGNILNAYNILSGTRVNCAGGPTPWGTWLSCEEVSTGMVHECDPFGQVEAVVRPALGVFKHEAVTVDSVHNRLYLTEDEKTGRFYRFTPASLLDGRPDLSGGTIDVLQIVSGEEGAVKWLPLPDPSAAAGSTREQVPQSTAFAGGEGVWYHEGIVYFSTKRDDRVWAYDVDQEEIVILYDDDTHTDPILDGVDNVMVTATGDLLIAEDGGDMQIVALVDDGSGGKRLLPLVQVEGQDDSEITGPALDPYRKRLYFSSQRGESGGVLGDQGVTYEITGPFFV